MGHVRSQCGQEFGMIGRLPTTICPTVRAQNGQRIGNVVATVHHTLATPHDRGQSRESRSTVKLSGVDVVR